MSKRGQGRNIPALQRSKETTTLEISFKHLDTSHKKFDIRMCSAEYFCSLLLAIQKYSGFTVERFRDQNKQADRHVIDFSETSELKGFTSLEENLQLEEPWLIKVCPEIKQEPQRGWRASGVLVGNILFLVWLDPEHKLYPDYHPSITKSFHSKK